MTAQQILRMIETVDPADTATLDEIDQDFHAGRNNHQGMPLSGPAPPKLLPDPPPVHPCSWLLLIVDGEDFGLVAVMPPVVVDGLDYGVEPGKFFGWGAK